MSPRGSLLLEAILATGLAATFGLALTQLVLVSSDATLRIEDHQEANYAALQGLEALESMSFSSLTNLTNGHPVFSGSSWSTAASTETLWNGMTRAVSVQDVQRDGGCVVVASGGTVDIDSKNLTSTVSWTDQAGLPQAVTYVRHRTNYESPLGDCFNITAEDQISTTTTNSEWYNANRRLRQAYIRNDGATAVTIDKITFTWSKSANITTIVLDATTVWSSVGPGTPAGIQASGATLDIQDFTLTAGQTAEFTNVQFQSTAAMSGDTITFTLTFSDGSTYTAPSFIPR